MLSVELLAWLFYTMINYLRAFPFVRKWCKQIELLILNYVHNDLLHSLVLIKERPNCSAQTAKQYNHSILIGMTINISILSKLVLIDVCLFRRHLTWLIFSLVNPIEVRIASRGLGNQMCAFLDGHKDLTPLAMLKFFGVY